MIRLRVTLQQAALMRRLDLDSQLGVDPNRKMVLTLKDCLQIIAAAPHTRVGMNLITSVVRAMSS